jgi:AhpC/TSA family
MTPDFSPTPELKIQQWFNTDAPLTLRSLRGRVVALHVFQMLCPACVSHGLPQAQKIRAAFAQADVAVIGLHSVFEHHDVMTAQALRTFIHEYGLSFPIGIDQPSSVGPLPLTMQTYDLRGTPSLLLFDRDGRLRLNHFGHLDDLRVGALIGQLLAQASPTQGEVSAHSVEDSGCDATGCGVPESINVEDRR